MATEATLEAVLRRDRQLAAAMLAAIAAACWAYLLAGAGMDMPGMDAAESMALMAPATWSLAHAVLMLAMWWVMMTAMMLPTTAPMVLLFAAVRRKRLDGSPQRDTASFILGYLVVWGGFSLAAVALQWSLADAGLVGADMAVTGAALAGGLLVAAGLYQLTPLKRACLRQCRDPVRFLAAYWRKGAAGAVRMGIAHGFYCLGCCWALMLLLFIGGAMNLYWIGGLALFVLFEKLMPAGHWLSQAAGVALVAAGGWLLAGLA